MLFIVVTNPNEKNINVRVLIPVMLVRSAVVVIVLFCLISNLMAIMEMQVYNSKKLIGLHYSTVK